MKRRHAFTIAELLVVVGILVVLMALLLPVLRNARETARNLQCTSNVRSIAHAMLLYANENDGALPQAGNQGQRWVAGSPASIAYYFKDTYELDFVHGAIMRYLGDTAALRARVMRCPNADNDYRANYSYDLNENLDFNNEEPKRISAIPHPQERILIFEDDNPDDGHFNLDGGVDQPSIHHFRHGNLVKAPAYGAGLPDGSGNYGFADGHVETLTRQFLSDPKHTIYADLGQ